MQTSNYDASYGRNSGAAVNVITKSGSNDWHGALFEYFRNDDMNANTFFANEQGLARGSLKQNQFGGTFGGPIIKNKLFFFTSYEGTRQVNAVASLSTSSVNYPEQLTNSRSASALGAAVLPPEQSGRQSWRRVRKRVQPHSQHSRSRSPTRWLAMGRTSVRWPWRSLNAKLPNGQYAIPSPKTILNAGTNRAVGFSAYSVPASFREQQALLNLDPYLITPWNTLALRYFYADGVSFAPFNTAAQPYSDGQDRLTGNQLFLRKVTTQISPSMINEFHFSSYYIRAFQGEPGSRLPRLRSA